MEASFGVAECVITTGRSAFDIRAKPPLPDVAVDLLRVQLTQFATDDRGKVTGKTADGENDDLGMAALLALYWRLCVMSADASVR